MNQFFAYVRVSTQKQGQLGVSLQEQRAAIERYALKQGLTIIQCFEERETAAKRGRPIFNQMLAKLRRGIAKGVIIHKIDRSARNLKDWSDLGELIDAGVEVHFATESLDLHTRGGRLSADIQAVVAADYIRNLREEAKKGFYGRLSQGVYPLPAPAGYLDRGPGKPKEPNPETAPIVRRAFEIYATGTHSITSLQEELSRLGLRNRGGQPFSRSGISTMLSNPFYIGLIRIEKTSETFRGTHQPIIPQPLFQRVQDILQGRTVIVTVRHDFQFRRLLKCATCGYSLAGDLSKGRVYYRCWRSKCVTNSIREDTVENTLQDVLQKIRLLPEEIIELKSVIEHTTSDQNQTFEDTRRALELRKANIKSRADRLLDAYVDHMIDKHTYDQRRTALLEDEAHVTQQITENAENPHALTNRLDHYFELAKAPDSAYLSAFPEEKRQLLLDLTSNRVVGSKSVDITPKFPFDLIANRPKYTNGGVCRASLRTLALQLLDAARLAYPSDLDGTIC